MFSAEYTLNIFRGVYIIISPMVIKRYLALEKKSVRILWITSGKIKLTTGGNFVVLNVHVKGYFLVLNVHVKGYFVVLNVHVKGYFAVLNVHVKGYFVLLNVHVKGAIL